MSDIEKLDLASETQRLRERVADAALAEASQLRAIISILCDALASTPAPTRAEAEAWLRAGEPVRGALAVPAEPDYSGLCAAPSCEGHCGYAHARGCEAVREYLADHAIHQRDAETARANAAERERDEARAALKRRDEEDAEAMAALGGALSPEEFGGYVSRLDKAEASAAMLREALEQWARAVGDFRAGVSGSAWADAADTKLLAFVKSAATPSEWLAERDRAIAEQMARRLDGLLAAPLASDDFKEGVRRATVLVRHEATTTPLDALLGGKS